MEFDWSAIDLEAYAMKGLAALTILAGGWLIAAWLGRAVKRAGERSGRLSPTVLPVLAKLTRLVFLAIAFIAALNQLGVQTSGLFAMIGAAGLALGLALKDTVSDVAAGIVLLVLRPFDVGEAVNIGGTGGIVQAIDLFQTRLTSFDGVPIVLNNSAVRTAIVQNYSRAAQRRIEIEVRIGYGDDIGDAITAITHRLEADTRVLREPAWVVNTRTLADNAVVILVRCMTRAADYEPTLFDLTRAIKEAIDAAGLHIPPPQRELLVRERAAAPPAV
ncbi:MAG: mechanosensitive ion channel family protein [Gammaproteobacteria bacterium]|nr:mechanosensitive ion channel family protein [Gammaproteobacteria bacterium]